MLRDSRQLALYGTEVTQPQDHLNLPSQMRVSISHFSPAGLVIDHGNVGFIPNVDGQHPLGGRFSFPSFPATNSQESLQSVYRVTMVV